MSQSERDPQDRQCPVSPQELREIVNSIDRGSSGGWAYKCQQLRTLADWLEKPAAAAATCGDCGVLLPCKPYEHREGCSKAASEPTRAAECEYTVTGRWLAKLLDACYENDDKTMTEMLKHAIDNCYAAILAPPTAQARPVTREQVADLLELGRPNDTGGPYTHQVNAAIARLRELGIDVEGR